MGSANPRKVSGPVEPSGVESEAGPGFIGELFSSARKRVSDAAQDRSSFWSASPAPERPVDNESFPVVESAPEPAAQNSWQNWRIPFRRTESQAVDAVVEEKPTAELGWLDLTAFAPQSFLNALERLREPEEAQARKDRPKKRVPRSKKNAILAQRHANPMRDRLQARGGALLPVPEIKEEEQPTPAAAPQLEAAPAEPIAPAETTAAPAEPIAPAETTAATPETQQQLAPGTLEEAALKERDVSVATKAPSDEEDDDTMTEMTEMTDYTDLDGFTEMTETPDINDLNSEPRKAPNANWPTLKQRWPPLPESRPVSRSSLPANSLPVGRLPSRAINKQDGFNDLKDFWGKRSVGFARPAMNKEAGGSASRLSKVEAEAALQRLMSAGAKINFDEVRELRKQINQLS